MTARYGESPLSAERRREVTRTWDDSIKGLRPGLPYGEDDWKRAEAGLDHLRSWEELAGRPRRREVGAGVPTLEEFLEIVKGAAGGHDRRGSRSPSATPAAPRACPPKEGLWDYTWVRRSQAYRWMADFRKQGHPWLTGRWLKARYGYGRLSGSTQARTKRDELGPRGGRVVRSPGGRPCPACSSYWTRTPSAPLRYRALGERRSLRDQAAVELERAMVDVYRPAGPPADVTQKSGAPGQPCQAPGAPRKGNQ